MYKFCVAIIASCFLIAKSTTSVYAHAFGQQYVLPVPFSLYAYGAAASIVISFLLIGYFFKEKKEAGEKRMDISNFFPVKSLRSTGVLDIVQVTIVVLFFLTILSGVIGTQRAQSNFNMTFFWIISTVGLTYACAIFGNIYEVLNPWKIMVEWVEKITGEKTDGIILYPKQWGYYPALILYIAFIWIELMGRVTPLELSILIIVYTLITFLGVYVFGKKNWFSYGEFFGVFYEFISTTALFETEGRKTFLRMPFSGLFKRRAYFFSEVLFIIFMLASTSFDGFRDTTLWWNMFFIALEKIQNIFDISSSLILQTCGLLFSPVLFFLAYWMVVGIMKFVINTQESVGELTTRFAYSLIPIALVYNIAHYYTLLFIQGQSIIYLISDPFGKGWNLFGTASFTPNITFIDTSAIWHTQVAVILLGHIAGVYVAHKIALHVFPSPKKALISQIPMLVLMIGYTVLGLWILSQPLGVGL